MRRIKRISFLVFAALLLTGAYSVNAQSYSTATNNSTQAFEKAGIDLNDINATLEDATEYSKIHYKELKEGTLGYSNVEADIAQKYFFGMTNYLSNNGQKAITVSGAITTGYVKARSYVMNNHGESEMNFLLGLVEQTVQDLQ